MSAMLHSDCLQLLCLSSSSGVPLFSRGSSKTLPFSVIGSLNGVHMFGAGHGTQLSSCETSEGSRVVWRVFHDSMMLIAVSSSGVDVSELQLRLLLENVWNCMILVLGQEELTNMRNVERLKRELRACYGMIDRLLERVVSDQEFMGDLTQCCDCMVPCNTDLLKEALGSFTKAAESEFGCLIFHGRVALATEKWWSQLAPQEVILLSILIQSLSGVSSFDHPVFLPKGSPTIAIRLLGFQLLPAVYLCILCGPKPSLYKAGNELVGRFWSPLMESLRSCSDQAKHYTLPPGISIHRDVQAFLLINMESGRGLTVCSNVLGRAPAEATPPLSSSRCFSLLRSLYTFAVSRYFFRQGLGAEQLFEDFSDGFTHVPLQCYLVTDQCKCYALQSGPHQLYLLTDLSVPTFALRSVAAQLLTTLTAATGF